MILMRLTGAVYMTQFSCEAAPPQPILGYGDAVAHLVDDYYVPKMVNSLIIPSKI